MSIYYKTYAGGRKSKVARIVFRDHENILRELSGYASKRASQELDRLCHRIVEHRMGGLSLTTDEVYRLRDLDDKRKQKLAKWGLIDAMIAVASSDIMALVDEWEKSKKHEGVKPRWFEKSERVRRLLDGAGLVSWVDACRVDAPERVRAWLSTHRRSEKIGEQTEQHYIQAVKQFVRWVRVARWAPESPIETIAGKVNVKQVRERGVLTREEFGRLVQTTMERDWRIALVYGLAGTLGCDASTLRTLTRGNCEKVDGVWCVTHRRSKTARQGFGFVTDPLIAGLLERRLAEVAPATPILEFPRHQAVILQRDLKAAKIPYKDASGKVRDFHSLRAFAANEVCRVAQPKTAMDMLAHANIKTTMRYAKHAMVEDMLEAARRRPNIVVENESQGKIG